MTLPDNDGTFAHARETFSEDQRAALLASILALHAGYVTQDEYRELEPVADPYGTALQVRERAAESLVAEAEVLANDPLG